MGGVVTVLFILFATLCFSTLGKISTSIGFVYAGFIFSTFLLIVRGRAEKFSMICKFPFGERERKGLVRLLWVIGVVAISSILFAGKRIHDGQDYASYVLFLIFAMWVIRELALFYSRKRN
jgi:hypothetical protein